MAFWYTRRGKRSGSCLPSMMMMPLPGCRRTRAMALLRRPTLECAVRLARGAGVASRIYLLSSVVPALGAAAVSDAAVDGVCAGAAAVSAGAAAVAAGAVV